MSFENFSFVMQLFKFFYLNSLFFAKNKTLLSIFTRKLKLIRKNYQEKLQKIIKNCLNFNKQFKKIFHLLNFPASKAFQITHGKFSLVSVDKKKRKHDNVSQFLLSPQTASVTLVHFCYALTIHSILFYDTA